MTLSKKLAIKAGLPVTITECSYPDPVASTYMVYIGGEKADGGEFFESLDKLEKYIHEYDMKEAA